MLAQIIRLVEQAQASKAPIQRLADLVSSYFVPAVMFIAIWTFVAWFLFGPAPTLTFALVVRGGGADHRLPVRSGLATPLSIMVGTGKGATSGILIRSAEALETAHKLDTIILDKTGTITAGAPALTDVIVVGGFGEDELLRLVASAERSSEHPLGAAIVAGAIERGLDLRRADRVRLGHRPRHPGHRRRARGPDRQPAAPHQCRHRHGRARRARRPAPPVTARPRCSSPSTANPPGWSRWPTPSRTTRSPPSPPCRASASRSS